MWGAVNCPLAEQKSWMTDPATIILELSLRASRSCGAFKILLLLTTWAVVYIKGCNKLIDNVINRNAY